MVARTGLFVAPLPGNPPVGTSPTDGRLVLGSAFGTAAGCLAGGAFTASGTAMQVTVGQSVWRIPDPTNANAVFLSPADPVTLTFSAGPASGSRIDVVWVKQDNYENSDADSRVTYGVAVGVASATPTAPAVPAGAMKIGTLTVPTGASNAAACTFVPAYPATVVPPMILASSAALIATVIGQFTGQRGFVGPDEYRWNGAGWDLMPSARTMCNYVWAAASDVTLASNAWTDIPNDTAVFDPYAMRQADGVSFKVPWTGRYALYARAAPFSDDLTSKWAIGWFGITVGQMLATRGQVGASGGIPIDLYTEEIIAANAVIKPQMFRSSTSTNYILRGSGQPASIPRSIIRYLGPS